MKPKPKGKDEELRMPADAFDRIMGQVMGPPDEKKKEGALSGQPLPTGLAFCEWCPRRRPACRRSRVGRSCGRR